MSKFFFSFLAATLLVAQTKVDLKSQAYGYAPTQASERSEDEWCPTPTFSRVSDTVLSILPQVSASSKCYLHFSAFPVNVKEYSTPVTLTVSGTLNDLVFVYWKLIANEPKLHVSARNLEQLSCSSCLLELRTEESFPKGSIIVGLYGILAGKLAPSGHPLISSHQIAMAEATAMLMQYYPDAGYVFQFQSPTVTPAAAQQLEKLQEAKVNLEVANTNSLVRALETSTVPGNVALSMEGRVEDLEKALAKVESLIPAKDSDVTTLRSNIARANQELERYRTMLSEDLKRYADIQLEQITAQYQSLQRRMEAAFNKRLVSPPTKPNSACEAGVYSQDAKYKYECLRGLWYRFTIDASWK
jgi:hypothetical protein